MTRDADKKSLAGWLLKRLLVTVLIMVAVHLLLQYLNLSVYHEKNGQIYELSNRFDLDDESSVPTWFSQVLFMATGVSAILAAYLQTSKSARRLWGAVAAFSLLFSLDESAGLHEHILQSLHVAFYQDAAPTISFNAWWLVLPFVALAAVFVVKQLLRLLPRRTTLLLISGTAVLLIGAVFVDVITSTVSRDTFLSQGILVALEEGLELLGSIVIFYAVVDYLEKNFYSTLSKSLSHLKA